MDKHTVTSNTPFSGVCNNEELENVADQGGRPTLAFDPLQESFKPLTFKPSANLDDSSPNHHFPPEILSQVFDNLTARQDLLHCTRVSKMWCECAIKRLWRAVSCLDVTTTSKLGGVLMAPQQTFTYAQFIRFLEVGPDTFDHEHGVFSQFVHCDDLKHLSLVGCHRAPEEDLIRAFAQFQNLTTINLCGCTQVTDDLLIHLARTTKRLENINLRGCGQVTDKGISVLAGGCPGLRCFEIGHVPINDSAVTSLEKSCPLLTSIILHFCPLVTDLGVRSLWQHSAHMQDILLSHSSVTGDGFTLPPRSGQEGRSDIDPSLSSSSPALSTITGDGLLPATLHYAFDHTRLLKLDLSMCFCVTDETIERIISHAPNIQYLYLMQCHRLTSRTVEIICKLGKTLRNLGFGNANNIMDSSIRLLARSCTELRSLDIGSCTLLTLAVIHFLLQKLDKLALLTVHSYPPFRGVDLRKAYGSTFVPDEKQSAEDRMNNGYFLPSDISHLRNLLAGLQEENTVGP